MDPEQYLDVLRRDAVGLLRAARAADPASAIAACPEWAPLDLVWHIGKVHRFWATIVAERLTAPMDAWPPPRPATEGGLWTFAEESAQLLVDALRGTDPATAVWTWSTQHDAAWVLRRMAHETAVHRVDAERAAGADWRVDPYLAADGIDEFLTQFLPQATGQASALGGSVHIHCTDVEGEWTVRDGGAGALVVAPDHAKADAALRGGAHDLLMALWRRDGLEVVEVFGDGGVATRFVTLAALE